jgi:hypothetical protein
VVVGENHTLTAATDVRGVIRVFAPSMSNGIQCIVHETIALASPIRAGRAPRILRSTTRRGCRLQTGVP